MPFLVLPMPSDDTASAAGIVLFDAVCARDMEGVLAKIADGHYTPKATLWVKIKNRAYSQAEARQDFFDRARAARA